MSKIKKFGAALMCFSVFMGIMPYNYTSAASIIQTDTVDDLEEAISKISSESDDASLGDNPQDENKDNENSGDEVKEKENGEIVDTTETDASVSDDDFVDTDVVEDNIDDSNENEDEVLNDDEIEEDVILEDMDAVVFSADNRAAGDYEAEYRWHLPGGEEHVEYGTFEEMWNRMYAEKVGTVKIFQNIVADKEFIGNDGNTYYGFGTGNGFTESGGLLFPEHRYEEGTTDYSWPRLNMNGYVLDKNCNSELAKQGGSSPAINISEYAWGSIINGTVTGCVGSAINVNGSINTSDATARMVLINVTLSDNYAYDSGALNASGRFLISVTTGLTIKNNYSYNGNGAGLYTTKGLGICGDIYIYDNFVMRDGAWEQSNLYLDSKSDSVNLNTGEISGKIGISSSCDVGHKLISINLDKYDLGNVVIESDDINYLIVPSGSNKMEWQNNTPEDIAEAVYYRHNYGDNKTGDCFYGTAEEVWNYACEQGGIGTIYLKRDIRRKVSDKSGAPDFPVFGWGENFTEDGAFLLKVKSGEKIRISIGSYNYFQPVTIDGMYDSEFPDENGIGHVFVVEGSDQSKETTQLFLRAIDFKNTGNSAVYMKSGMYSELNAWKCSFENCYAERGGALRLEGGYTDLGDSVISNCYCTDVGGAIYVNSKRTFGKDVLRGGHPNCEWYHNNNFTTKGMVVGDTSFRALSNYRILPDGTKEKSNIYLALENRVTMAGFPNGVCKNMFGLDAEGGLKVEIINNGSSSSHEGIADNSEWKVVSSRGIGGTYNTKMFVKIADVYASTKGWDEYTYNGTLEEMWNWASGQQIAYIQINGSYEKLKAGIRSESEYPDYPVFGMGPGFSETGQLLVHDGQEITLHLSNCSIDRNLLGYEAQDDGFGFITVQNGGTLRLEGLSKAGIINCASSAIRVEEGGELIINGCHIFNNKSKNGAAIWNQGIVRMTDVKTYEHQRSLFIYDNNSVENGGGIWNDGVIEIKHVGRHCIIANTSGTGNKIKPDNIYLTKNGTIKAIQDVGDSCIDGTLIKPYDILMGIRSELADTDIQAVAIKDYFAVPSNGKTVEETLFSDNILFAGFKQDGNDLVFDLSRETKQMSKMSVQCFVFDGSSWFETAVISDGIWKAEFDDKDGYLFYVELDKVDEVFKDWGFDVSSYSGKEIGFGTREDNGTDTITNTIKPIKKDGKTYVPAGIVTEYTNYNDKLKLYFTSSKNSYNHKEINYADLNEFRVDGRVQISIVDRQNNIKRESFGLDQPYSTTVDWLDGYEWFVYYLNDLPFNESLLTKTYDGFKLNIDMKSVPYPLMIRESEAKRVFNVLLKANVDGNVKNFDRLPEISGPKLYNGQAQFYLSGKVLDDYLSAFGYKSSEYNGEKIFGYRLKGSNEIIPLDIVKSEDGDWEFLLPNPDNNPYGFDDGELYLYSRESEDVHYVGESIPDEISFYSVRIDDIAGRNDWHYTDLSTTYYSPVGDPYSITLPVRSIGTWTCNVDCDMKAMAGNMYMKIDIDSVTCPVVLTCGENGGMTFTVQYYGALEQLDYINKGEDGYIEYSASDATWNTRMTNGIIDVADTSGAILPTNKTTTIQSAVTKQLKMDATTGHFKTHVEFLPLNNQKEYVYEATPSLSTVLRTYRGSHYEITELWVLKNEDDIRAEIEANKPAEPEEPENPDNIEGSDNTEDGEGNGDGESEEPEPIEVPSADSTNRDDWIIYTREDLGVEDFSHVQLMNIPTDGHDGVLQIREGDVLRFIYTPVESVHEADVMFYDYDITDGYWYETQSDAIAGTNKKEMESLPAEYYAGKKKIYVNSYKQGINNDINYRGNTNSRFQFGNANHGAGNEDAKDTDGYYLNQANIIRDSSNKVSGNSVMRLCCFGIASGIDSNNNIIYNEATSVPYLFDEAPAMGKTTLTGYKLNFTREGDVFTLTGVKDNSGEQILSNLDTFFQPNGYNALTGKNVKYSHIWTNNFWPLDTGETAGKNGHDPLYGLHGNMVYFKNMVSGKTDQAFPPADDFQNHNSFFGMHYEIRFRMPEDYIGPMEYVFFGDDDLWIFLDDQLVMDIGGVHSSAGEYLNLWDYIEQGDTSEHRLSIFYTERGSSGSTCYMRFIIPNARFMDMGLSNMAGAIYIEKSAVAARDTNADYNFSITLKNPDGTPYEYVSEDGTEGQPYIIYNSKNNVSRTGFITGGHLEFTLKDMESILIPGVKQGTLYEIEEEVILEMDTWVQKYGSEAVRQHWIEGVVSGMSVEDILYTNTWKEDYVASGKLPDTGGNPYYGWIIGLGVLLMGSAIFAKHNRDNRF